LFNKSAKFYDSLYHFKDYHTATDKLDMTIRRFAPNARSLLDTACGTGKHIQLLMNKYECEGLDLNQELLDLAAERCPGVRFICADMTDFDAGRTYDVVTCLFSSIAYVRTRENLFSAVKTMTRHLDRGGLLMIEPWFSKETFWTDHVTSNHYDSKDLKITWMYTSKIEYGSSVLDIHYLIGTPHEVTHFTEKHVLGLFSDAEYREALEEAGLEVYYDKEGLFGRGMYIGVKN
jgi:ubiquinone/menaquinone biosynthesis C-methylase UbiE